MKLPKCARRTAGSVIALTLSLSPTWADTLPDNPLIGTSGDGLIFSDPEEGVLPPGVKAVTFTRTRTDDDENPFDDPYGFYITDFDPPIDPANPLANEVATRGDVVNCLMANNADIYCDSDRGSGKRVKVWLTGPTPFDMTYQTVPGEVDALVSPDNIQELTSIDTTSVDYFTFGKVSNFTGARITGFELQLLDANGELMDATDPANTALFNLAATQIGLGAGLVDGLYGDGGNEGDIGFFSDAKTTFDPTFTANTLRFDELVGADGNTDYQEAFGAAFLDNTMVPDGLFWDDNGDPTDEAALVAWYSFEAGGWVYGNLALEVAPPPTGNTEPPVLLAERLIELADALGVDVADLDYDSGVVPDAIVAAAEANRLFAVDLIEDLRNANLNYTLTIGDVEGEEFTIRWVPEFATIVTDAQSEIQFKAAGYLDAAANIPYWDLGNAGAYQIAITDILALDETEQAIAVTSTGFSIAPAFSGLGFETGRDQVAALMNITPVGSNPLEVASQSGTARSWSMGDGLSGLFSAGGSTATYDATSSSIGYEVSATSFTVGLEKSLSANASVGVALGAANATADAGSDLGEVETTGISLTAFTRSQLGNGAAVQALFGYQDLSYDSTRSVQDETATGSTNGSQIFGALTVDYLRDFGAFRVGPTATVEYYDITVDGFTETGADIWNLTVEEQSASTFLGSVGVVGEYRVPTASGDTRLTGSVAYTMISGDDLVVQSGFVGLPSASFPVQGLDENLVDVSFGFESTLSSNASRDILLSAAYDGAFGDTYERHGVQVGLNFQF